MAAGGTYEPITNTTIASATQSVTFSSIPQTYTDLIVVINGVQSGGNTSMYFRYNGDAGTNYGGTYIYQASGPGSAVFTNSTVVSAGGLFTDNTSTIVEIANYSNSTKYKTSMTKWSYAGGQLQYTASVWRNTAAITSIEVRTDTQMAAGVMISIYGIAAA